MPRYSLKCVDCDYEFDVKCKFEELEGQVCPKCKSENLNRIYKSIGINTGTNFSQEKCST